MSDTHEEELKALLAHGNTGDKSAEDVVPVQEVNYGHKD